MNKRLKTPSLARWIETIDAELRDRLPRGNDKVGDGKPMVVGGFSHDPDARWGKTPGDGWAKGYKLHAIIDAAAGAIEAWQITPLDAGEATVLRRDLVPDCDLRGGVTLRADANYDSNPTYRAVAAAGGRLIAPRRKPGTGLVIARIILTACVRSTSWNARPMPGRISVHTSGHATASSRPWAT